MPRKSDRTKKTKASPEKAEKPKRTRTSRRRKASSSSEAESDDSNTQLKNAPKVEEIVVPQTESGDAKVWQVKSDDSSSGTGEIKKLKICLSTKLPATPEPEVATPRSRKKLNRTVSEAPSEGTEEKRRSRHKSRRAARESHDGAIQDMQSEDDEKKCVNRKILPEEENDDKAKEEDKLVETQVESEKEIPDESKPIQQLEVTIQEPEYVEPQSSTKNSSVEQDSVEPSINSKQSVPELEISTPVVEHVEKKRKATPIAKRRRSRRLSGGSPEREPTPEPEPVKLPLICEEPEQIQPEVSSSNDFVQEQNDVERSASNNDENTSQEVLSIIDQNNCEVNSENIETKVEENVCEKSEDRSPEVTSEIQEEIEPEPIKHDSIASPVRSVMKGEIPNNNKDEKNKKESIAKSCEPTPSSEIVSDIQSSISKCSNENESIKTDNFDQNSHSKEQTDEKVSKLEEPTETYNATPIVVSRKRRWGSRVSKSSQLTPVCISTDVLKDIIPEVKPVELEEAIEEKQHRKKSDSIDRPKVERPILPKIVIDNSENANAHRREQEKEDRHERQREEHRERNKDRHDSEKGDLMKEHRKISIIKENSTSARPPSPPRHKSSNILYITHLVRPFTLAQLKNLLQRTGKILDFWIDRIKSKCFVIYENEDQAIETRHALHGVTWPVSNPKTLQVDFSSQEHLDKIRALEENKTEVSAIPGTVEDWLKEQDMKKERQAEMADSKSWDKRTVTREWDVGKADKDKEREKQKGEREDDRITDKRRRRSSERSPVRKFPKKEEEAPAKMLDDLFRKTKTMPCIYWLPLSEETIAIKEEQRRQHMAENERRLAELERARAHRRH